MPRASPSPPAPRLAVDLHGDRLALAGSLDIRTLAEAERALGPFRAKHKAAAVDLHGLERLDTPGAQLLCSLRDRDVELVGMRAEHAALLDLICGLDRRPLPKAREPPRWRRLIMELGRAADEVVGDAHAVLAFVGHSASAVGRAIVHPHELRLPALSRQVSETGVDALPIVGLLAVMISVVIAYQAVAQLRPYGGEDLTIDLVAVSVLREMGVLVTAIMVAGRSGAAFTAEIGTMRARDEIDALKVMGVDPMALLVVPRVIGIVITLPLLTFYSDVMGLAGGALIGHTLLGMTPLQYLEHVRRAVDGSDLFVGLVKAPVFAFVIGAIGCMHGMSVRGSAESVGRETTRAVVASIFLVIVLDALFSILFERLGL